MKASPTCKTLTWVVVSIFFLFSTAQAYTVSRIIPSDKVKVYQDGRLIRVIKSETLLEPGLVFVPEGDCGLRMDNLFVVAKGGSKFSVLNGTAANHLKIEGGLIFFAANSNTGQVLLETPEGMIGIQQILIHASTNAPMLKGYVDVTGGETRFGILEGGSVVVSTPDGTRTVNSGKQIVLAQALIIKPDATTDAPQTTTQDQTPPTAAQNQPPVEVTESNALYYYIAGAAVLSILLLLLLSGGSSGDDAPLPVSPSTP
jgi:hypothetical protein